MGRERKGKKRPAERGVGSGGMRANVMATSGEEMCGGGGTNRKRYNEHT